MSPAANRHPYTDFLQALIILVAVTLPFMCLSALPFTSRSKLWKISDIVQDIGLAFSQVYDILTKGGDCLMLIVGKVPAIYDVYKEFPRSPKWCRWVKRLDVVLPPYHDCDDPQEKIRKITKEVGFKNVFVQCNKSSYKYDCVDDFKGSTSIVAISPFKIPEELCKEYFEEFVRVAMEQRYITDDLTMTYTTYTFIGRK